MYFDPASGVLLPEGVVLASVGRRIGAWFLAIPLVIVTLFIGQGHGFIRLASHRNVFFHRSDVRDGTSFSDLAEGQSVRFELLEDEVRRSLGLVGASSFGKLDASCLQAATPANPPDVLSAFPLLDIEKFRY